MLESKIEKYLVKKACQHGDEVRKVQWVGRRHAPDRLLLSNTTPTGRNLIRFIPRQIWIELKKPGVKPNDGQLREHERMRHYGLDVRVIDSIEGVDALWSS